MKKTLLIFTILFAAQTTTAQTTIINNNTNVNVGTNAGGIHVDMNVNITETETIETQNDVLVIEEAGADCYIINESDFKDLKNSLSNKSFEDSKLTLAKQITKKNCLTAMQIKKIMLTFDFEDTKLEFAKHAYASCYNPENYWKVNDAFEFEMTIDELNEFIEEQ